MLLDGNSLAFRAFYALPAENFKTQGGLTTNAVYGFTAMLINLLRDEQPTHIAAAFDVSRQTFRVDKYPEYKAGRSATPDEFRGQIDITKEVLVALGITVLAEPGFEADDIIATLATQAEDEGYRVLVVSGDRDSLQLVSDDVTVLYPRKGVSELTRFTPDAVVEKYGLTPQQYPDFAALRGDPSDNLPGIPGVGEKTATKWIVEYGSLQALVDNVDAVKGKVGDALRANLSHRRAESGSHRPGQGRTAGPDPRHAADAAVEPRPDPPPCSTTSSSGCCATACSTRWPRRIPRWTRASTCVAARWSRASWPPGWPSTAAATDSGSPSSARTWRSTPTRRRWPSSRADGDGRYLDTAALDPDDEAALASWLADADPPKALHEAKLADARPRGPRLDSWPASPPTPHWRPIWCAPGSAASRSTTSRCAT